MEDFDRGAKRKCTSCSTLFLILENPQLFVQTVEQQSILLTNISKREDLPKLKR